MNRIPRVFQETTIEPNHTLTLNAAASHHLFHVLRMRPSQIIIVFNGDGYEYEGVLLSEKKGVVSVAITEKRLLNRESSLHIHLGQALSKSDHMDFTLQKSVELGVQEITPLFSQHSEKYTHRLEKKLQYWHNIIISATEQCGRTRLPTLHAPLSFSEWVKRRTIESAFILDPIATKSFLEQSITSPVWVAIGPEGGFSSEERELATQAGFAIVHLGPRVLRTETASLATLTTLQLLQGDLGKIR